MRMGIGMAPAKIMIVGECFSAADDNMGEPFASVGAAELNRILHDVGLMRSECYLTNVVNAYPAGGDIASWLPERKKDLTSKHVFFRGKHVDPIVVAGFEQLVKEVELVQPNIIVALGNLALWALTGADGVKKWRGSMLMTNDFPYSCKVIPTYHPHQLAYQWEIRGQMVRDLSRVKEEQHDKVYHNQPAWNFTLRPNFTQVVTALDTLRHAAETCPEKLMLDFDLETRAGHIACAGIGWTKTDAICIPFMCVENRDGYWMVDEEAAIVFALYKLLTHKNVAVRWQNGLYDAQYTYRHWHFIPNHGQDTMISFHTLYAGLPKSLAFQASLLCDHYVYWKDDGKTWEKNVGEDQLWSYNCVDCVRTREVGEVSASVVSKYHLEEVEAFQQKLFHPVLQAMVRGVRIDKKRRQRFADELLHEISKREEYFAEVLGHPLNPASPIQMQKLFYNDLGVQPVRSKAKKGKPGHVTCDDDALEIIKKREPLTKPIINAIQEYRSLGVFLSTFVTAPLDVDGRMRCSYNICGTETYRFNSSKNAFGSGTNLQNVPKGGEEDGLTLPNVRSLFVPDPGFTFFDMDLDRADLQVVAWEADDPVLKEALKLGVDLHLLNAYAITGREPPDLARLVESHEDYEGIRAGMKKGRQFAKSWCHGTNYGGKPRTMAAAAGITVYESELAQKRYFGRYPGILKWHERTMEQLNTKRYVENKFGYRRYYFDRLDSLLPEALAWVPQSTVACYINRVWVAIYDNVPDVWVLLQVHDSLAGQFPTHKAEFLKARMKEEAKKIIVPYDDPLIIPVGIKTSPVSWGDCE